ncbi:flagellar hook-associated protein FlgK [Microbacteriaceae bacterium 4G12]
MKLTDYNTSLTGMLGAQLGLSTTKQNISNLHTDGYVRQRVDYRPIGPNQGYSPSEQIGYGVDVAGINRVTDEMKTAQYNQQTADTSYYDYITSRLSEIENSVGTTDDTSLSGLMDGFFQAWREIGKNPTEPTYYQTMISAAEKFSVQMNRLGKALEQANSNAVTDLNAHVEELNRLSQSLTEVNKKLGDAGPNPPNQLLDERDKIITDMSKFTKLDVAYESSNPNVATVRINGTLIVSGKDQYPLQVTKGNQGFAVTAHGSNVQMQSGTIEATLQLTNNYISDYQQKLDTLTNALENRVNGILQQNFFVGNTVGTFCVNPNIVNNGFPNQVSADVAYQLSKIGNEDLVPGVTYAKSLDQVIVKVATDKNSAKAYLQIHQDLLTGIEKDKLSVEGVNLDEEMVNLMSYQNYFTANSKAIRTLNETFESLFAII